jgi:predicted TPR repeat methyltransferase
MSTGRGSHDPGSTRAPSLNSRGAARLSVGATDDEEAVAINSAILAMDARDVVALIRLGRAYAASGKVDEAKQTFSQVLEIDPTNSIADRRLHDLDREHP